MDHIKQKLLSVMHSYMPVVPDHRYSLNFVPVVSRTDINIVKKFLLYDPRYIV